MFDSQIAHIVYSADDKFSEVLGISLVSLYYNNKDLKDIYVYILDGGISQESKEKLQIISEQYDRKALIFIPAKNVSDELGLKVMLDRGSWSQYARLFIAGELRELSRVIYLDCDIIINSFIDDLWNLDLQGKMIGALQDAFSKFYRVNIGLKPSDIMFNSGVMVIDLDKWRSQNIEDKLLQFIVSHRGRIQQGDQGVLNAVLSQEVHCIAPKFNAVTIFYDFSYEEMLYYREPPSFYNEEEVTQAIIEPVLIHFTTSFISKRPWIEGCKHRYLEEWNKYKELSPWKGHPLWEDSRPKYKKLGVALLSILPRRVMLFIARLYI